MYTLIPTVYRNLLKIAIPGNDHRIHTTKETLSLSVLNHHRVHLWSANMVLTAWCYRVCCEDVPSDSPECAYSELEYIWCNVQHSHLSLCCSYLLQKYPARGPVLGNTEQQYIACLYRIRACPGRHYMYVQFYLVLAHLAHCLARLATQPCSNEYSSNMVQCKSPISGSAKFG